MAQDGDAKVRYHLESDQHDSITVDLISTVRHDPQLVEFEYAIAKPEGHGQRQRFLIRKLAGEYFSSHDGKCWQKLAAQIWPNKIVCTGREYGFYRGFRPSGLTHESSGQLRTQMPGKIVKMSVSVGDRVKKGDLLLTLEAMKMENEVRSTRDGIVKAIHCHEGQTIETGFVTLELEKALEKTNGT